MIEQHKYKDEIERFKSYHGYEPDLDNPKTFSEKVVFKKLFDRNPLLILTADKYRVRNYIREHIGWQAENHLIPLYWVGKNPYCIPWDDLPRSYIVKPNNGAGRWILVEDDHNEWQSISIGKQDPIYERVIPKGKLIQVCKDWFKTVHGAEWYEWCYGKIDPLIIIEKVIFSQGDLAFDYKIFMFNGKPKIIYVLDRNDVHMTFYDLDWNQLPVSRKHHPLGKPVEKPRQLDKMLSFAEELAKPFDFVRIDFFVTEKQFYFGEITHYPGSGHGVFEPTSFDKKLGTYWKLDKEKYEKFRS